MKKIKLEEVIQSLVDSLELVPHNPAETDHVLSLIKKYKAHYTELTRRHYTTRKVTETFPTREEVDDMMQKRFEGL